MNVDVDKILTRASEEKVADVHFTVGIPVHVRRDGVWVPYADKKLTGNDCVEVARILIGDEKLNKFYEDKECDASYSIPGIGRFRINIFLQRGSVGIAVRVLPHSVPGFAELGLPAKTMTELCSMRAGIVLVCGPTGSGKSTTLASMISYINRTKGGHIVTIEDPIEYLHDHQKGIVDQREIGDDTHSFAEAMRHVLRQTPDTVLVGEIRDPESVRTAIMIAETGHLMFSTIHTGEVIQGLSRLIDMFPPEQEREIRVSLSMVLRAMIVQQLLRGEMERKLVLATEVMKVSPAIAALIREGKYNQVYGQMQMSREAGMNTMNASLIELWRSGEISAETALAKSPNIKEIKTLMEHTHVG